MQEPENTGESSVLRFNLSICQCHSPSAVNKRHQNSKGNAESQPRRKSIRLQEIRDSSQQRIARAGKWTRPSPGTTKTRHHPRQEQPQAGRRTLRVSRERRLDHVVRVIIYNADQHNQTTPDPRGQRRIVLNEPKGTKEWLVALTTGGH